MAYAAPLKRPKTVKARNVLTSASQAAVREGTAEGLAGRDLLPGAGVLQDRDAAGRRLGAHLLGDVAAVAGPVLDLAERRDERGAVEPAAEGDGLLDEEPGGRPGVDAVGVRRRVGV